MAQPRVVLTALSQKDMELNQQGEGLPWWSGG